MTINATAREIQALLALAEADGAMNQSGSQARRASRQALARRVPGRLLDPYELLLEVGRVPAVVPIEHGACSGCHVRLPTMLEYAARRSPAVHRCPRCRRMLYAPGLVLADVDELLRARSGDAKA